MRERDARETLVADLDVADQAHVLAFNGDYLDGPVECRGQQQRAFAIDGQSVRMRADVEFCDQLRRRGLDIDDLQEIVEQLFFRGVVVTRRRGDDGELAIRRHGDGLRRTLHRMLESLDRTLDDGRELRGVDDDETVGRRRFRKRRAPLDANEFTVLRRDDDVGARRMADETRRRDDAGHPRFHRSSGISNC